MQADLTKALDSYELTLTDMVPEDVPRLHELSIAVNWPHRPKDWELAINLGRGYLARDEIGRVLGSAMWFPMGETLASIGMVITSPRLQDHGAGRWLMHHVLSDTTGRSKVLNATKGGLPALSFAWVFTACNCVPAQWHRFQGAGRAGSCTADARRTR